MSRQVNPTLIGIFVMGAIVLAVTAILLLAGGDWLQQRRQVMMFFEGEANGLQVGAPVVFLGVKVGTVKQIQLGLDESSHRFMVPVTAELDPQAIQGEGGRPVKLGDPEVTRQLVQQGLRAQLRMKSLLTGQLYVDLDFHPDKKALLRGNDMAISEIPTIPTTVEELANRLEDFPVEKFLADVAAISESVKTIIASAASRKLPEKLEATLRHMESLAATLDSRGGAILDEIEVSLTAMQEALVTANKAIGQIGELTKPDSAMVTKLQRVSEELAGAARALHELAEDRSPTIYSLNTTLQEVSRAARAMRTLAETLEQHPEAILRGKQQ